MNLIPGVEKRGEEEGEDEEEEEKEFEERSMVIGKKIEEEEEEEVAKALHGQCSGSLWPISFIKVEAHVRYWFSSDN